MMLGTTNIKLITMNCGNVYREKIIHFHIFIYVCIFPLVFLISGVCKPSKFSPRDTCYCLVFGVVMRFSSISNFYHLVILLGNGSVVSNSGSRRDSLSACHSMS